MQISTVIGVLPAVLCHVWVKLHFCLTDNAFRVYYAEDLINDAKDIGAPYCEIHTKYTEKRRWQSRSLYARSQNCEKQLLASSCLSVRLSVRMKRLGSTGRILMKLDI